MANLLDPTDDPTTPKKGLIDALMGGATAGNAGIAPGEMNPNAGPPPVLDQPMATPPIQDQPKSAAPAQDFGRLMGVSGDKLNDPNKHDFKYDTMRTLSQFDPRQGFTPDAIAALNKLDYGTFSGSGDKLALSGAKNSPDAADFSPQDWVYALKANNGDTKWNFGGGGAAQQGGGAPTAPGAGGSLNPLLQGDPQAGIQSALGQYGQQSDFLKQLLAKLGGSQ